MESDLLQAEGEEIEGIGLYNEFLDNAREQGDEHAQAVISEAIADEHDHAHNFAEALGDDPELGHFADTGEHALDTALDPEGF